MVFIFKIPNITLFEKNKQHKKYSINDESWNA